jgi:DNA-binding response OmpR family regulator
LIIDDNLALAENVAEILACEGCVTEIAGSGEEALTKPFSSAPDVVVTDYRLPGVNGADLIRALRKMGLRPVAIIISARTDDDTVDDAYAVGAAFLPKPIDFSVLAPLVRNSERPD